MQLGLVLTLTVVYALFEHKTEIKSPSAMVIENYYEDSDNIYPKEIVIERVKAKKFEPIKEELLLKLEPEVDNVAPVTVAKKEPVIQVNKEPVVQGKEKPDVDDKEEPAVLA